MKEQDYINAQDLGFVRSAKKVLSNICHENSESILEDDYKKVMKILWNWENSISQEINIEEEFDLIPILITRDEERRHLWRCEISDDYEQYKPKRIEDVNFEDVSFHFNHDFNARDEDGYLFSSRKEAVNLANWIIKEKINGNGKIIF